MVSNRVLIVAFDALRPDMVTPDLMPNLCRFAAEGARVPEARSTFPTETRVNQTALVPGCYPERHGIVGNRFQDADASPGKLFNTGDETQLAEGDRRLEDAPSFTSLIKGLDLKANGIAYASPQANKWGLELNEISYMGKPEGSLEKVYEIYKESMESNEFGMVSLFKAQKDGLLIESNSTVNTFGGYIVHSIFGIGIAVASSLNDLQESGLFEDLGGFGGPPEAVFDDEAESGEVLDLDLPVNP